MQGLLIKWLYSCRLPDSLIGDVKHWTTTKHRAAFFEQHRLIQQRRTAVVETNQTNDKRNRFVTFRHSKRRRQIIRHSMIRLLFSQLQLSKQNAPGVAVTARRFSALSRTITTNTFGSLFLTSTSRRRRILLLSNSFSSSSSSSKPSSSSSSSSDNTVKSTTLGQIESTRMTLLFTCSVKNVVLFNLVFDCDFD